MALWMLEKLPPRLSLPSSSPPQPANRPTAVRNTVPTLEMRPILFIYAPCVPMHAHPFRFDDARCITQ